MSTKGLFITFEGLSPTIADSQVIIHIQDMRDAGIDIDLWAFAPKRNMYAYSLPRLVELQQTYGQKVRLFRGVPPTFPFSELFNAVFIWWLMHNTKTEVSFVHARTDYAAAVCGLVKVFRKFMLIWDCRGDAEAEYLSKYSQTTLLRRLAAPLQKIIIRTRVRLSIRRCDKAIFVSNKLKGKLTVGRFKKPSVVIPCVASKELFYFSKELRDKYRRKLGIVAEEKVIVYSGSMGGYQIFDKCVELFKQMAHSDSFLKFLVITPYLEHAAELLKELPSDRYLLMKVPLVEVNGYLNAADFGMFLRASATTTATSGAAARSPGAA